MPQPQQTGMLDERAALPVHLPVPVVMGNPAPMTTGTRGTATRLEKAIATLSS